MTPEEIVKAALAGEILYRRMIEYAATQPDGSVTATVYLKIEADSIARLGAARARTAPCGSSDTTSPTTSGLG